MKKYLIWVAAAVVVVAVFIVFLQINGGDKISDSPQEDNSNKIYIGVYEPFSGINSEGGYQERLGIEYANSLTPKVTIGSKEYQIELIYADNASDTDDAEASAQNLVDNKVSAVLGSYGSAVTLAGEKVFDSAGIPAIGVSCSDPDITLNSKYYFRVGFLDTVQGTLLADYAYSQGLRKAAVLELAGDDYSKGLGQYFSEEFQKLGGTAMEFGYNTVTMSYTDLIAQVKDSGADFVFMPGPSEAGAQFLNQMRQSGGTMPIYGGDTWDTFSFVNETIGNATDVYFSSQFDESGKIDTTGVDFVSKFTLWLGQDDDRVKLNGGTRNVSPVSALGYDAYNVLVAAIKSAGSTSPSAIRDAIAGVSIKGATGNISFDSNGDCVGKTKVFIKSIDTAKNEFITLQASDSAAPQPTASAKS